MTSEPKDTTKQAASAAFTASTDPDFARDLGGDWREYNRRRNEDAKAALIKNPKDAEPPQEKPRPDT